MSNIFLLLCTSSFKIVLQELCVEEQWRMEHHFLLSLVYAPEWQAFSSVLWLFCFTGNELGCSFIHIELAWDFPSSEPVSSIFLFTFDFNSFRASEYKNQENVWIYTFSLFLTATPHWCCLGRIQKGGDEFTGLFYMCVFVPLFKNIACQ